MVTETHQKTDSKEDALTDMEEIKKIARKFLTPPSQVHDPLGTEKYALVTVVDDLMNGRTFQFQLVPIEDLLSVAPAVPEYHWRCIDCAPCQMELLEVSKYMRTEEKPLPSSPLEDAYEGKSDVTEEDHL